MENYKELYNLTKLIKKSEVRQLHTKPHCTNEDVYALVGGVITSDPLDPLPLKEALRLIDKDELRTLLKKENKVCFEIKSISYLTIEKIS